jgi:MFS family permease
VALGGSTAILCAGKSLALLLVGRFLQGLSASVVWTVGLALVSDTVEKEQIGQAMGYTAAAFSIGSLAGPLLGGVVYAKGGYYAVFAMGFALIGVDILLRLLMIEKSMAAQWSLSSTAIPEDSHAPEPKPEAHSSSSDTRDEIKAIQPLAEPGSVELPLEAEEQSKTERFLNRLPPILRLLLVPRLLVSLFGSFVSAAALAAFDSDLPIFVKNTFSWNSQGAGLIFISLVVPSLFSPLVGSFSDKFGSRAITTAGFLGSVPFWVCLRFVTHDTMPQKILLCVLLTCIGTSVALAMTPLMAEIDHVLVLEEKRQSGSLGKRGAAAQGYGLFNMSYALGSLIGPLCAGYIAQSSGWGTMGWTFGIFCGVAGITTFWWTGGRIKLKGREGQRTRDIEA